MLKNLDKDQDYEENDTGGESKHSEAKPNGNKQLLNIELEKL